MTGTIWAFAATEPTRLQLRAVPRSEERSPQLENTRSRAAKTQTAKNE